MSLNLPDEPRLDLDNVVTRMMEWILLTQVARIRFPSLPAPYFYIRENFFGKKWRSGGAALGKKLIFRGRKQCFFWAQIWAAIFDGPKFGPLTKIWAEGPNNSRMKTFSPTNKCAITFNDTGIRFFISKSCVNAQYLLIKQGASLTHT